MGVEGPLSQPRLRVIEQLIDDHALDEAQYLLSDLGEEAQLGPGATYLATRLLFMRGRLAASDVVDRLTELLETVEHFPEAERMLADTRSALIGSEVSTAQPAEAASDEAARGDSQPPYQRYRERIPSSVEVDSAELDSAWESPSERQPAPEAKDGAAAGAQRKLDSLPVPWVPEDSSDRGETEAQVATPLIEADPTGVLETPVTALEEVLPLDSPSSPVPDAHPAASPDPAIPPAPAVPQFSTRPGAAAVDLPGPDSYGPATPQQSWSDTLDLGSPEPKPEILETPSTESAAAGNDPGSLQLSGRYSGAPPVHDAVVFGRGWRSGSGRSSAPARSRPAKRSGRARERARIRSGLMPPVSPVASAQPTPVDLAKLLDEGRFSAVLSALGPEPPNPRPELVLMRARALAGLGQHRGALAALNRLGAAPLLDPDLRAAAGRLLLELGDCEAAFQQTRRAFSEAPDAPQVQLAHAWAALRLARRRDPVALAEVAASALASATSGAGPYPTLVIALQACIEGHAGDPERSLSLAESALASDPKLVDAQAAAALALACLQRTEEAQEAWLRLHELHPGEAAALRGHLTPCGVALPAPARSRGGVASDRAEAFWHPAEAAVMAGNHNRAVLQFEQACRQRLSELAKSSQDQGFSTIGELAATVLTTAPVWQHFAPYDLSLWSVARVDAALGMLYGFRVLDPDGLDEFPVTLLVGSYLGELLCRTHDGHWDGSVMDLEHARVVAQGASWTPFRLVKGFLRQRAPIEFELPRSSRAASDPWLRTTPAPCAPPIPWAPSVWPSIGELPRLGRAMSYSVVSRYCEAQVGVALDGSVASLAGLDRYLALLAPAELVHDPSSLWLTRVAVLAGAYLGEVLADARGGQWLDVDSETPTADAYRLRLAGDLQILPVAHAVQRMTGRSSMPLRDFAAQLLK